MPTLEIFDKRNGFLSFDLGDLLEVIAPFAPRLDWYVVEFEPAVLDGRQDRARDSPPSWITELWKKSEAGTVQALSWERLKELSTHVTQTMNALFVATDPGTPVPNSSLDPNDERYRLVVQAVDTSFWAVTTHDENVLQALKARFNDVKLQPATKRYF
jgi:hypothetical protein